MKKFLLLISLLLSCTVGYAQLTAVTGVVQDSAGQLWKNGNYRVDFIRNPNQVGITPLFNGSTFLEHHDIAALDGSAAFSISLPPVTSITPSGGLWSFQFCPNATAPCTSFTVAVQGATLNLSAIITSFIKVPALNGSPVLNKAYSDAELRVSTYNPNSQATLYYDVSLNCIKYFDGSIWQCVGTGPPGSVDITATLPIVVTPNPITNTGDISCPTCITSLPPDTDFYQLLGISGTNQPQRNRLNLIAGLGISLVNVDNAGTDSSDLTISTQAVSGQHECTGIGLGDGVNVIAPATYNILGCVNNQNTVSTWLVATINCYTDNIGTSTLDVLNNAGVSFLTAPITCNATKTNGGAIGTLSGSLSVVYGDAFNFVFVADGVTKSTTWTVKWQSTP